MFHLEVFAGPAAILNFRTLFIVCQYIQLTKIHRCETIRFFYAGNPHTGISNRLAKTFHRPQKVSISINIYITCNIKTIQSVMKRSQNLTSIQSTNK
jgi:hypothetical protein